MFPSLNENQRNDFLQHSNDSFIPGYTGHCPTLKFHYGKCYGTNTKEILKELRSKKFYDECTIKDKYRSQEILAPIIAPNNNNKSDKFCDYALDYTCKAPRYITGYTGFVPTLNFRYGKSYSKAADDSFYEYNNTQRRIRESQDEINKIYRVRSTPKMIPIKSEKEMEKLMNNYYLQNSCYQDCDHQISVEHPPIAGYTGHIPHIIGNEASLSQRYHIVVKRGLSLLQKDRENEKRIKEAQQKITQIVNNREEKCPY